MSSSRGLTDGSEGSFSTMSEVPFVAIIIAVIQSTVHCDDPPIPCFDKQTSLADYCKNELKGVADGGRCFFPVDITQDTGDTWATAWRICKVYGSVIAQIHTAREYKKIMAYAKTNWANKRINWPLMVALKDSDTNPQGECIFNSSSITYYKDATTPDLPVVSDTWLAKNHGCDDKTTEGLPRCFHLSRWNITGNREVLGVQDDICNAWSVPLCQYTNQRQEYTLTKICIGLTPTQTMQCNVGTDCAVACSATAWCRSFNFIQSDSGCTCELFTWSSADTKSVKTVSDCSHYDYI